MGFRFFSTYLNLITLISVILLAAMALEWLLAGFERIQNDVFKIVFCVVAVLFTAKYYYGPDITTYAPLYDEIGNLRSFFAGNYPTSYEVGYVFYCSFCHSLGLSFWGMTALLSVSLFIALYCLVKRLRYGQVMALTLIVIMNPDLIYAQFRQCLAVTLFIFLVLAADKRRYLLSLILAFMAVVVHKSAIFMIVPTMLYYIIQPRQIDMKPLGMLLLLLCLLALIPTRDFVEQIIMDHVQSQSPAAKSLKMHLSFANLWQSNLIIYSSALVALMTFSHAKQGRSAILVSAIMGLIVIVVFYQYYLMLNRLRSYFIPFIVVAIIEMGIEAKDENAPWNGLVRQTGKVIVFLLLIYKTYAFDVNSAKGGDVLKMSTVFELADISKEELYERQMERAQKFWDEAFLKGDDLEYQSKNYVDQYKDDPFAADKRNKKKSKHKHNE